MNLNQLRHLIALAEHHPSARPPRPFSHPAEALSRSIQALEQDLDVRLVDRDGKRTTLTAYGELVAAWAERILFEARELETGGRAAQGGAARRAQRRLRPNPRPRC